MTVKPAVKPAVRPAATPAPQMEKRPSTPRSRSESEVVVSHSAQIYLLPLTSALGCRAHSFVSFHLNCVRHLSLCESEQPHPAL